jgi:endonuclease/exonuclease/phosphatase family metal-dependent hydrolase
VVKITLWNTEWTKPATARGALLSSILQEQSPDVICVTEGYAEIFAQNGHVVTSAEDYGYRTNDGRRKVLLWSRSPWTDVDAIGSTRMPSGRFIAGTTETLIGRVRVIGVCILWQDAHVRTGRKDREKWQDHLAYLHGLAEVVERIDDHIPNLVLGDFNQRIPRNGQPHSVHDRLMEALGSRFKFITGGALPGLEAQSIDHVAVSKELEAAAVGTFSNVTENGTRLSDHFGLRVQLRAITR